MKRELTRSERWKLVGLKLALLTILIIAVTAACVVAGVE